MDTSRLESIGLSKAEIQVYLALLKIGACSTGAIAQETNQRKSTVYECLKRLIEKGLVSYAIHKSIKVFEATQPNRLLDFIREKKRLYEEQEEQIKSLLPELESLVGSSKPKAEAHVLVGIEGFKTMRRDVLRHSRGELMLLGAISREDKVMPYFFNQWDKDRIKRGIFLRILHKRNTNEKPFIPKHGNIRFLPAHIDNPAVINVYGDRVVNLIWKGENPVCFMMINNEIAQAYKKYFDWLWKLSRPKKQ